MTKQLLETQAVDNAMSFGFVPDYTTGQFDIFTSVSWLHLLYLSGMEVVLISKCVTAQLARAIALRNRLLYVEVRSFRERIYRTISKENLNCVIERSVKRKRNYALFDRHWYLKRGVQMHANEYEGLCVDWNDWASFKAKG